MLNKQISFLYAAWIVTAGSTAGSFFFSYFLNFEPCVLCWYQRIFMFPLVLIIGVGFLIQDTKVHLYAIPVAFCGWAIALYHNLLYYKVIAEKLAPCAKGASCTEKHLNILGFISIPLLSFLSFSLILILLYFYSQQGKSNGSNN